MTVDSNPQPQKLSDVNVEYDNLEDHIDERITIDFDLNQFAAGKTAPGRTTFGRAWGERIPKQLKTFFQASAEHILASAHELSNPLGLRALEPEDKSDVSNRSEQRYIEEKATKVTQALCEYVFPVMDLNRPGDETRYDDTPFLELQSYLGLTNTAANQGNRLFDEETTRESGAPGSGTYLHYIKQTEAMEIVSMVNGAITEMVDIAKQYYSIDRHVDVAIDVTYVAYYGDCDEFQMSTGAPSNKSYDWWEAHSTPRRRSHHAR